MRHHDKFSPSSAPALLVCPHFKSDKKENKDAELGSYLHSVLESLLKHGDGTYPLPLFPVAIADLNGVFWAYEFIVSKIAELENILFEQVDTKKLYKDGFLKVEQRLPIFKADGFSELSFGTVDCVYKHLLFDLKSGEVKEHKEQLAFYSLSRFQTDEFDYVVAFEVFSRFRKTIRHDFTRKECERIVVEVVDKVVNKNIYSKRVNDYCQFCRDNLNCQVLTKSAETVPTANSYDFDKANSLLVALNTLDKKESLELLENNKDELFKIYNFSTQIEKWAKRTKESVSVVALNHFEIEGLKQVERAGSFTVADLNGLFNATKLSADRFLPLCSLSITSLAEEMTIEEIENLFGGSSAVPVDLVSKRGEDKGRLKASAKKKALELALKDFLSQKESSKFVQIDKLSKIYKGD